MNETLPIFDILMGLFGGLAIFLLGMEQMTDALKSVAGAGMSTVLNKLTKNRFMAAISGAFVTAVILVAVGFGTTLLAKRKSFRVYFLALHPNRTDPSLPAGSRSGACVTY